MLMICIQSYHLLFASNCRFKLFYNANRVEVAAMFGSVECFKYFMMNGDVIDEDTCKFAVARGNIEIIHLCKQIGFVFEDCISISSKYHDSRSSSGSIHTLHTEKFFLWNVLTQKAVHQMSAEGCPLLLTFITNHFFILYQDKMLKQKTKTCFC